MNSVKEQVGGGSRLWRHILDQVHITVWGNVGSRVNTEVGRQINDQVGNSLRNQVREHIDEQC